MCFQKKAHMPQCYKQKAEKLRPKYKYKKIQEMNGDANGKFICSAVYILNFEVVHWDIGEGRAFKDWVGCRVG